MKSFDGEALPILYHEKTEHQGNNSKKKGCSFDVFGKESSH